MSRLVAWSVVVWRCDQQCEPDSCVQGAASTIAVRGCTVSGTVENSSSSSSGRSSLEGPGLALHSTSNPRDLSSCRLGA